MTMPGCKKKTATPEADLDVRIKKEVARLKKIFVAKSDKEKKFLEGPIERLAFMRVQLEDMETDLKAKGFTEMFTQSDKAPAYERERPMARMYNSLNKNYQTLMKQVSDFVDRSNNTSEKDDGFDEFVNA